MQFDTVNNIGIGTNSIPSGYKLAVNGNAIFTKIRVKNFSAWADYVFRKDYRLPSLTDLEHYVNKYHHLPGIASEQDVLDNGLDIGDHQP